MPTDKTPSQDPFDVSIGPAELADGERGLALKLASSQAEVNIWFSGSEVKELPAILSQEANAKALRIGASAGSRVHWSRDKAGRFYLLIGEDDETWDVGLTLDTMTINAILAALAEFNV